MERAGTSGGVPPAVAGSGTLAGAGTDAGWTSTPTGETPGADGAGELGETSARLVTVEAGVPADFSTASVRQPISSKPTLAASDRIGNRVGRVFMAQSRSEHEPWQAGVVPLTPARSTFSRIDRKSGSLIHPPSPSLDKNCKQNDKTVVAPGSHRPLNAPASAEPSPSGGALRRRRWSGLPRAGRSRFEIRDRRPRPARDLKRWKRQETAVGGC